MKPTRAIQKTIRKNAKDTEFFAFFDIFFGIVENPSGKTIDTLTERR